MDIEDAMLERLEERCADQTHESREAYETNVTCAQNPDELAVVAVAIGEIARADVQRLDAGFARAREPGGIGAIGDDDRNGGVERTRSRGVDDRLQIGSAAGDEN